LRNETIFRREGFLDLCGGFCFRKKEYFCRLDNSRVMKKTIFTILAITLVVCGCNKTKQFKVILNLQNADNKTVYLYKDAETVKELADGFTTESVYSRKVNKYLDAISK
jgi:hypothetical protein